MVAFDQGMAATMEEAPQGGTYPVAPTPEFLQRSVRKTVELYNSEIGAATKIKRVVVGTGIASVSYFATMMGAANLPIHYLVSIIPIKMDMPLMPHWVMTVLCPEWELPG